MERENNLEELRRRVDALFESATGRVGPTHAELSTFVARLNATGAALLRQRFPEECSTSPRHEPKRQRRESVVCSGSWERKWETVAELELERGDGIYEEISVQLDGSGTSLELRQFSSHFWCSGCRLWDSAVALARHLHAHPELVRGQRVVELGCGVAPVPGLCAVRLRAASVRLTEGEPNLMPSVRHNVARVLSRCDAAAGACGDSCQTSVAELNWSAEPAALVVEHGQHDVLLGSDLIYSSGAAEPLAAAATALVREGGRLLLTYPAGRHGVADFRAALEAAGWGVQEQALEHTLLRGCANQGTEQEVAAHTFLLLDARRAPGGRSEQGGIIQGGRGLYW